MVSGTVSNVNEKSVDNFGDWFNQVKAIINTYFPNNDIAISGSKTETKTSLHTILMRLNENK